MTDAAVHVGIPPEEWECWESRLVHFHHFESIPSEKGHSVSSPIFECCGTEWALDVYTRGEVSSKEGMMAFYLCHCSRGAPISAKFCFLIRDTTDRILTKKVTTYSHNFANNSCGWRDFARRDQLIYPFTTALNHGTLTIEVRIKPDDNHCCLNFIPKNECARNILLSFMDKNTADIVFEVQDDASKARAADRSPVVIYAHKLILQLCAKDSALATICEADGKKPVPIKGIDPHLFT
mmetsp:Transcript_32717/g.69091  ORF Transcript_32717/g.69091 Transcript_32717/m.69091 type:complete len:237 (-) Transcript_32717:372-1082(-)